MDWKSASTKRRRKDGTKIPYFQVARKDLKLESARTRRCSTATAALKSRWSRPTRRSRAPRGWKKAASTSSPTFAAAASSARKWHQAALKENRHRAYEDFAAVAEDLVEAQGHDAKTSRRDGRQQRRPVDGQHVDALSATRSGRSSARCRCSTCSATTSCSPARVGWPSTATRTCRRNGTSCALSRRITT